MLPVEIEFSNFMEHAHEKKNILFYSVNYVILFSNDIPVS